MLSIPIELYHQALICLHLRTSVLFFPAAFKTQEMKILFVFCFQSLERLLNVYSLRLLFTCKHIDE